MKTAITKHHQRVIRVQLALLQSTPKEGSLHLLMTSTIGVKRAPSNVCLNHPTEGVGGMHWLDHLKTVARPFTQMHSWNVIPWDPSSNENPTSAGISTAISTRIHVWEKPKSAQLQTCTWFWSSKCGQHNEIIWLFTVKHVNQVTSVHLEIQQNQITEGGHSESYSVLLIPPAQKPIRQPHQYPPSKQLWTQGPQPIVFQHPAREPMIDQYCQSKLPGHRLPTMVSSHQLQLMNLHQLNFHQLVSKLMSAMRWPHLTVSQWTVQRWPCSPLLKWESQQTNNTNQQHLTFPFVVNLQSNTSQTQEQNSSQWIFMLATPRHANFSEAQSSQASHSSEKHHHQVSASINETLPCELRRITNWLSSPSSGKGLVDKLSRAHNCQSWGAL